MKPDEVPAGWQAYRCTHCDDIIAFHPAADPAEVSDGYRWHRRLCRRLLHRSRP